MTTRSSSWYVPKRRSPVYSFLLCSLFSDALGVPQAAYFDFPRWREWGWLSVAAVQFAAFRIRSQNVPLRLTNRRLYIGLHVQDYLAGARRRVEGTLDMMGSKRTGRRYRDPSLSGGGGAFVEKTGAGARERPDDEGGDGAKRRSSRYHREPPEHGKQRCHDSGRPRNAPDEVRDQVDSTRGRAKQRGQGKIDYKG